MVVPIIPNFAAKAVGMGGGVGVVVVVRDARGW